jgi:hypothetical protein
VKLGLGDIEYVSWCWIGVNIALALKLVISTEKRVNKLFDIKTDE